jgi:catechol 2,3-dioxygenase-like lactoylglutathione lyase family enzyme
MENCKSFGPEIDAVAREGPQRLLFLLNSREDSMRLKIAMPLHLLSTTAFVAGLLFAPSRGFAQHPRPKITGISHIAVYTSDPQATEHYYTATIGAARESDPENPKGVRYVVNATQFVEVLPLPANAGVNRLDHVGFNTDNAEGMRAYLADKKWQVPAAVTHNSDGSKSFRVDDPEGNVVEFVQPPAHAKAPEDPNVVGHHIIHVGFLVHSRANEDKFYEALLGFRPYWFGGMKDDQVDWVSQQTPDSHDWLEYMLHSGNADMSGTGIPAGVSQQSLGVLDHVSIGVVSVPESYKKLVAANRLPAKADKEPKIGKDGKYQFNMYDPDGIRLELMEFKAVEKPCCSPFTAEDPKAE